LLKFIDVFPQVYVDNSGLLPSNNVTLIPSTLFQVVLARYRNI
jgi:hypothetical protein